MPVSRTRSLILAALFAALTAVGAFLKLPMWPVPVTLQSLFAVLAGILLGPRLGAASQALYVALGLVGLPIFTRGGGLGYAAEPTFGFLLGLAPAAAVAGLVAEKEGGALRAGLAGAAGLAVLYAVGVPYLYLVMNLYIGDDFPFSQALVSGMLPFLPGDALKLAAAALLAPRLRQALRRSPA